MIIRDYIYEGYFTDQVKNGKGIEIIGKDNVYLGDWVDGKK